MSDIIRIDNNNIVSVLNNGVGLDIGKPFSQEIFLIEVHIAGTTHIDNKEILESKLNKGVEVKFYREPNNKYDNKAIVSKDPVGEEHINLICDAVSETSL